MGLIRSRNLRNPESEGTRLMRYSRRKLARVLRLVTFRFRPRVASSKPSNEENFCCNATNALIKWSVTSYLLLRQGRGTRRKHPQILPMILGLSNFLRNFTRENLSLNGCEDRLVPRRIRPVGTPNGIKTWDGH